MPRRQRRDFRQGAPGAASAPPREMSAELVLAVLDVIDHELAQEGPAALHAEQVARAELARIRSRR
jgi:hypothetical protein